MGGDMVNYFLAHCYDVLTLICGISEKESEFRDPQISESFPFGVTKKSDTGWGGKPSFQAGLQKIKILRQILSTKILWIY